MLMQTYNQLKIVHIIISINFYNFKREDRINVATTKPEFITYLQEDRFY